MDPISYNKHLKDNYQKFQEIIQDKPHVVNHNWYNTLLICYIIVITLGIISNIIVVCAILCHRKVRNVYHNLFIGTLAVSDLLICCATLPTTLWETLYYDWPFKTTSEFLCGFIISIEMFPLFLNSSAICTIAWDRHTSIASIDR